MKYLKYYALAALLMISTSAFAAYDYVESTSCTLGIPDNLSAISTNYGDSLAIDGWTVGDTVHITATGDPSNNGTYTITGMYPDTNVDGAANVSPEFPVALSSSETGKCIFSNNEIVFGCTDSNAYNYNSYATYDLQTVLHDGDTSFNSCNYVPPLVPSGVVWAMSALSIFTLIEFVYFLVFFMILYVIAWGILQVLKPIFRIITYGD